MIRYNNRLDARNTVVDETGQSHQWLRFIVAEILIWGMIGSTLLAGCAFMPFCADGRMFDKEHVSQIVEQKTTKQQILGLFGEPLEINAPDISSASFWRYRYVYLGTLTVQRADLGIHFEDDTVSRFQFNESESGY